MSGLRGVVGAELVGLGLNRVTVSFKDLFFDETI